ncbi:zinc finger protein: PROVISIONAL [Gigaspora margarita]|uniref:Zinc finger protein: PROVISIONAL n=1 Tax=Gigaspora margarita TaxID=4874 RepID=A0A8H3WXC9_GIGMA|nr:zinc finger protein: PROVISIONAL [Gigaspora margarita]
MYSVLLAEHDSKTPNNPDSEDPKKKHGIQKAKDIKKCIAKRKLRYDKFLECLRNKKLTWHDIYSFHSYDHQIYLERNSNPSIWTLANWIIKHLIASEIFLGEAEERAMKAKLHVKA